ncbi:MAG TPA: TadE/TadG family type IV pilus assembly protein [Kineosporiaceae bacterium]|nr:TadE/TadG family type IV pilus assembly protein [Kineosporiaceae bacterium]
MRGRNTERGATTVELAMYMPVLFFVIFVTVQAAMLFLGNQAASAAAREAARVARSGGGSAEAMADGRARGQEYAATVGHGVIENVQVQVNGVADRQIRATVTGRGIQVVPWLPGLNITQVAQGPIEEFRPDEGGPGL